MNRIEEDIRKIELKHQDFVDRFDYISREYKNKSTYITLKCKKCNTLLIKERRGLLSRGNIICNTCDNRKIHESKDFSKLSLTYEKAGCTNMVKDSDHFLFTCVCGRNVRRHIHSISKPRCKECSLKEKKEIMPSNKIPEAEVREWFISNNLVPLFTSEEYNKTNVNGLLKYRCICGNVKHIRYKTKHENNSDFKPMCKECAILHKRTGPNNSMYKEDKIGRNTKSWVRKVKKKFNNSCCVTGVKNDLVAHHLNSVSSFPELMHDVMNGVCLSREVHHKFHLQYDNYRGLCTRDVFDIFLEENYQTNLSNILKKYEKENNES